MLILGDKERIHEAEKLLAEVAGYGMSLVRFDENAFLIAKVWYLDSGRVSIVGAFSESDLDRLREIVAALKSRRDGILGTLDRRGSQ